MTNFQHIEWHKKGSDLHKLLYKKGGHDGLNTPNSTVYLSSLISPETCVL